MNTLCLAALASWELKVCLAATGKRSIWSQFVDQRKYNWDEEVDAQSPDAAALAKFPETEGWDIPRIKCISHRIEENKRLQRNPAHGIQRDDGVYLHAFQMWMRPINRSAFQKKLNEHRQKYPHTAQAKFDCWSRESEKYKYDLDLRKRHTPYKHMQLKAKAHVFRGQCYLIKSHRSEDGSEQPVKVDRCESPSTAVDYFNSLSAQHGKRYGLNMGRADPVAFTEPRAIQQNQATLYRIPLIFSVDRYYRSSKLEQPKLQRFSSKDSEESYNFVFTNMYDAKDFWGENQASKHKSYSLESYDNNGELQFSGKRAY